MNKDTTSKKRILNYIVISAAILWTGFIFSNSLQTASESLEQSGVFVTFFINIAKTIYGNSIPAGLSRYIELHLVEHIRSLAHIVEFFVLYLLAGRSFGSFHKIRRVYTHAFLYGLIVMAIDETIQIFVDGRGFQIKDLALDTLGMTFALVLIILVRYLKFKKVKIKPTIP